MSRPHPHSNEIPALANESTTFESFCSNVDKPHLHSSKGQEDLTNDSLLYETCWDDSIQSSFSSIIHARDPNVTTSTRKDTMYHSLPADQSEDRNPNTGFKRDQSDTRSDFVIVDTPQITGTQGCEKRSARGSTSDQSETNSEFIIVNTPEASEYQNSSFDIISTQLDSSSETPSCEDESEDAFLNISGTVDHENQTIIYTETPLRVTSAVEQGEEDDATENSTADDNEDTEGTLTASVIQNASNTASNESNTSIDGRAKGNNEVVTGQQAFMTRKLCHSIIGTGKESLVDSCKTIDTLQGNVEANGSNGDENTIVSGSEDKTLDNLSNSVDKMRKKSDAVEQWLSSHATCEFEDAAEEANGNRECRENNRASGAAHNVDKDRDMLERKHGQRSLQDSKAQTVGVNSVEESKNNDDEIRADDQLNKTDVIDDNNNSTLNPAVNAGSAVPNTDKGTRPVEMIDKQTQTDWESIHRKPRMTRIKVIIQAVKDVTSWFWELLVRLSNHIGDGSAKAAHRLIKWITGTAQHTSPQSQG